MLAVGVGLGLLVLLVVDALATTLAVSSGAGPVTARWLGLAWRVLLRCHRRDRESAWLTYAGTLLLTATVLSWVLWLWAAWFLVLLGSGAVVDDATGAPASTLDVAYTAGFTIFTLGTGDFSMSEPPWRVAMAAASFSGLFLVTLSITYLVSVLAAVVERRALAIQMEGLGPTPGAVLARGWSDGRFGDAFVQQLVGLVPATAASAEQHLAYPVLHYFHAATPRLAAPVAVARVDEALLLLRAAVAAPATLETQATEPLRFAIERYVAAAAGTAWWPSAEPPPAPDLGPLREAGVPLLDGAVVADRYGREVERRADLHALVRSDGWSWRAVAPGGS